MMTEQQKPPALHVDLVKEFVLKGHGDLGAVETLLETSPQLLNASFDWGGGDWETALGAAAHMGRRDIAETLLRAGARIDIFAAAMLGLTDVVQAIVSAQPDAYLALGPHGIPLYAHAVAGGDRAQEVAAYLASLKR